MAELEPIRASQWRNAFLRTRDICPRCGVKMIGKGRGNMLPHRASRDHILPQEWGGTDHAHAGLRSRIVVRGHMQPATRNIQIVCIRCNGRRASCLHCWALVACVDAVAKDTGQKFRAVYRGWKLGQVRHAMSWRNVARP